MNSISALIQAMHGIAATAWIGGIFFAFMALRPAANKTLEPAQRVQLWQAAYTHFFPWVWLFIVILLATGYADLFHRFDGFSASSAYLAAMHLIGLVMVLAFCYLYFILYRRLTKSLSNGNLAVAADIMKKMRPVMATNLTLGLLITAVGIAGP